MVNVLEIQDVIGRFGNHLLTLINAIYLAKKYQNVKVDYLFFLNQNGKYYFPQLFSIAENNFVASIHNPKNHEIVKRTLTGYMVFHISSYLNYDPIIDYNLYLKISKSLNYCITNVIKNSSNLKNTKLNYDPNQTLFCHLKYTDNLLQNLHIKYAILPINLYLKIFSDYPQLKRMVMLTDNPKCLYLTDLKNKLKGHGFQLEIISNKSLYDDFIILSEAKNVLLDLSTFTWTSHLISSKKQNIIMWDQFYGPFLSAVKNYANITLFDIQDMKKNYSIFKLNNYVHSGEWLATDDQIKLLTNWNYKNNFNWIEKKKLNLNSTLQIKKTIPLKNKYKICLVGPGIMSIPPTGWGAVEILIWEYYQELQKIGWVVDIINTPDMNQIISKINSENYFFIHIHYDKFYPLMKDNLINSPHMAITSHYPYINNSLKHKDDNYTDIFDYLSVLDSPKESIYYNIILSQKDKLAFLENHQLQKNANLEEYKSKLKMIRNGANPNLFTFYPNDELKKYPNKTLCLGWITTRKNQAILQSYLIQHQKCELIDFAGRPEDLYFDYNHSSYLGEWSKKDVYSKMKEYSNLILLSLGEADPLVVKEALMGGIGVVITESSAAHLDTSKAWITILEDSRINDFPYILEKIEENKYYSRDKSQEIRDYAIKQFSNQKIIKDYSDWLLELRKDIPKKRLVIVGTGDSEIPANGWGAVESIVWEYYTRLKNMKHLEVYLVNDSLGNYSSMISQINDLKPDIVHLFYDNRIDIAYLIDCPTIYYTTHWAYLPQIKDDKYARNHYVYQRFNKSIAFYKSIKEDKHKNFKFVVISSEISKIYQEEGVLEEDIILINNGANFEKIIYNPDILVDTDITRSVYLGKIDLRKRQYLLQDLDNLDFVGNIGEDIGYMFDVTRANYLGEWTREEVYSNLSNYASLVLLSDGEADPLVVKEALMAGCGLVLSEYATANLDLNQEWIDVIPEEWLIPEQLQLNKIKEVILKNNKKSIQFRDQIREYSKQFSWDTIIKNKYLPIV